MNVGSHLGCSCMEEGWIKFGFNLATSLTVNLTWNLRGLQSDQFIAYHEVLAYLQYCIMQIVQGGKVSLFKPGACRVPGFLK